MTWTDSNDDDAINDQADLFDDEIPEEWANDATIVEEQPTELIGGAQPVAWRNTETVPLSFVTVGRDELAHGGAINAHAADVRGVAANTPMANAPRQFDNISASANSQNNPPAQPWYPPVPEGARVTARDMPSSTAQSVPSRGQSVATKSRVLHAPSASDPHWLFGRAPQGPDSIDSSTPPYTPAPAITTTAPEMSPAPMPMTSPPRQLPRATGIVARIRDAIAVRRALSRAGSDDSVEVISGVGAPVWSQRPRHHVRAMHEARRAVQPTEARAADADVAVMPTLDVAMAPPPPPSPPPPPPPVAPPMAPTSETFDAQRFDGTPFGDTVAAAAGVGYDQPRIDSPADHGTDDATMIGYRHDEDTSRTSPIAAFPSDAMRTVDREPSPFAALREEAMQRTYHRDRRFRPIVIVRDWIEASRARIASAAHSAGASNQSRFITAVVGVFVLMAVGLWIGKSTASTTPTASNSIAPTTQPHAAAPPLSSSEASAAAVPQPDATTAPSNTASSGSTSVQLPNSQTLGDGATGYQVSDVRYGIHPSDFRIVFDMGPAGTVSGTQPSVTIGLRNATTVDVVFNKVVPSLNAGAPPAGGLVTSAKLLPSTTSGQTVYEFTLSHAATISPASYIGGPLRLVLDLT